MFPLNLFLPGVSNSRIVFQIIDADAFTLSMAKVYNIMKYF